MLIRVKPKSAYGETRFYPANRPAQHMAGMLQQAALTYANLVALARAGAIIEVYEDNSLSDLLADLRKINAWIFNRKENDA